MTFEFPQAFPVKFLDLENLIKSIIFKSYSKSHALESIIYIFFPHYPVETILRKKLFSVQGRKLFAEIVRKYSIYQGRNHGKILAATSVMVGKICPPW